MRLTAPQYLKRYDLFLELILKALVNVRADDGNLSGQVQLFTDAKMLQRLPQV